MKHHLFRLFLATAALVPVSSALAADLDPPPPPAVEELRPATYDWSGPYVGAYSSLVFLHGRYGYVPDCPGGGGGPCPPSDPEMSGDGFAFGGIAGWNFDMGGMVLGMEGDFGWGGKTGENRDIAEQTELSFDHIATARARAGVAFDDTLVYLTGGAAFANVNFSGEVGPVGASVSDEDDKWIVGWTAGGGIEHAFADGLTGRLEYLYMDFPNTDFRLEDPAGFGGDIEMDFEGVHQVRAALTYNFGW
jgi:outer membrane immunogenic protein